MRKNKFYILVMIFISIQNINAQGTQNIFVEFPFLEAVDYSITDQDITGPKLSFDKEFIDLGEVKKGEKRTLFYELTNTGTENLVIELISACDCTTVTYPKTPIKPGETIKLDVVFDSSEKEESEDIDIDIFFTNIDPISDAPLVKTVKYHFDLLK